MASNRPSAGVLASIHATGLSTAALCKRKWAWQAVAGLTSEGTTATAFGTEVHRQLEEHVKYNKPLDFLTHPDEAECALALLELLEHEVPHFRTGETERKFVRPMPLSVDGDEWEYAGTKDLEAPPGLGLGARWNGWTIVDYKTTSSIHRWAKTAEALRTDPQPFVYAAEFFERHPDVSRVRMVWLYVERKTQRTHPVELFYSREDVARNAIEFAPLLAWMLETCRKAPPGTIIEKRFAYVKTLPYNVDACEAFGGCEFAGRCQLGPEERPLFGSYMKEG